MNKMLSLILPLVLNISFSRQVAESEQSAVEKGPE